jgi:predicted metal-dependent peptidase
MLFQTNLTTLQRIDMCYTQIMAHERYRPIAGVLLIGTYSVEETLPTAATNGRDEFYGKKFVDEVLVKDSYLRFVILHEVRGHKLLRHLSHLQWMYDEDPETANRACDSVINLLIVDENAADKFAEMPMKDGKPLGLLDERFRGMDEVQVYNILRKEKEQQSGQGGQAQQQQQQDGFDSHDWEAAKQLSEPEQAALAKDLEQAIRQGHMLAAKTGSLSNGIDISNLLQVEVDYRSVLSEYLSVMMKGGDDATWRTLSRKYLAINELRPARVHEEVEDLVIAVDASGSTFSQDQLTKFMSEIVGMLECVTVNRVHLLYWDTEVTQHETYGSEHTPLTELASSTKPTGGGGTLVSCVPRYLQSNQIKPPVVIVLTDGHLDNNWGQWDTDVLWCVLNNKKARPTVGKTIHINL